jgi:hypothetical protein
MSPELSWFTVRLALEGISEEQASGEVQALQDELNSRPHLRNPQVYWEAATHRSIIQVDTEDLRAEPAAEQIAEELLEVASGVLLEAERVRVEILDVRPSPR